MQQRWFNCAYEYIHCSKIYLVHQYQLQLDAFFQFSSLLNTLSVTVLNAVFSVKYYGIFVGDALICSVFVEEISDIILQIYTLFITVDINRSSCPEVFCKKGVLRIFAQFSLQSISRRMLLYKAHFIWHKHNIIVDNYKFLLVVYLMRRTYFFTQISSYWTL